MALASRLQAFWLAWKWVVLLLVLLGLSVWGNVAQWKASLIAPLKAENKTLTDTMATINALARDAHADNVGMYRDLAVLVERGRSTRIKWRDVTSGQPLAPNCAPGAARVDAINEGLGPIPRGQ